VDTIFFFSQMHGMGFGWFFDPMYFVVIGPALILAMVAQWMVSSAYAAGNQIAASMNGATAARRILDANGMHDIPIEVTPGKLSDHYDPTARVVRLSNEVYHSNSMSAVGIAAHEVGHAMQHSTGYALMGLRNLAVPMANFGSPIGMVMIFAGIALGLQFAWLAWVGIALFSTTAFFQLVNLPVEFDASSRAKWALQQMGIVAPQEMGAVNRVLNAAALTYVAATLQSVLTMLYYVMILTGNRRRD
jgi:Zn-dependent membrane protease YugP